MNLLLSCLTPRSCLIECAWLWEDEPQRPRYSGELLQVWWVMQLLETVRLAFSLYIPLEKEIFTKLPEGFWLLRPIRKQPDHSMFLRNSSRAGDWLVVRLLCGQPVGLLVRFIVSFLLFLVLKGAEDDLRKVTDLAYKQVSYYFRHSETTYWRQKVS